MMRFRNAIALFTTFFTACGGPSINIDSLELAYINAYPDSVIRCRQQEISDRVFIACETTGRSDTGLWIYELGKIYAVNGTAIAFAEKHGFSTFPDAKTVDIPTILSEF